MVGTGAQTRSTHLLEATTGGRGARAFSHSLFTMGDLDALIGSRISLISQQDFRYDGVLFSINAAESSIVLQNGASEFSAAAHASLGARHRPF